jgi:uncharacterized protein YndB with AHSA1/START domain
MTGEVRLERTFRASRKELWEACATRSGLEAWYADRVSGTLGTDGKVRLEWPELGARVDLEVEELVEGRRIVFSHGETRVILAVSDGRVTLTHAGLDASDDVKGFESSWRVALAVLGHALEVHPGKPRRTRWVVRGISTSATLAHLCFTEPEAIATWLGRGATIGQEGEPYAIRAANGEHISGDVLIRDGGRDVAFSWREQSDSVLVFRTLPSPPTPSGGDGRIIAACWSKWGPTQAGERAVVTELSRALDRLALVLSKSGEA